MPQRPVNSLETHRQILVRRKWLAASSQWFVALAYLIGALRFGSPSSTHLGKLMELEFLAIHSGAFLGMLIIWGPSKVRQQVLRGAGIVFFGVLYSLFARQTLGWPGVFELVVMIGLTYAGLFISGSGNKRWNRAVEVGFRWLIALLVFMIVGGLSGVPTDVGTWDAHRSVLYFGALYFLALGAIEATGLYGLLRHVQLES